MEHEIIRKRRERLFLTPRENEALSLFAEGHSHRTVAETMGLTYLSLHTLLKRIYPRVGARNLLQAVLYWQKYRAVLPLPEQAQLDGLAQEVLARAKWFEAEHKLPRGSAQKLLIRAAMLSVARVPAPEEI